MAKTLKNNESLKACVRCNFPAKYDHYLERAVCKRESCKFEYCTKCLCAYHNNKDCLNSKNLKASCKMGPLPGTKKSKKNLQRLWPFSRSTVHRKGYFKRKKRTHETIKITFVLTWSLTSCWGLNPGCLQYHSPYIPSTRNGYFPLPWCACANRQDINPILQTKTHTWHCFRMPHPI